jgi:hypothetical protein
VHLSVVDPEGLDFDDRVAGLRLGFRDLFDYQMFNPPNPSMTIARIKPPTHSQIPNSNYLLTAPG